VIGHGFRGMLSGFGSIVAPSVTTTGDATIGGRTTSAGFTSSIVGTAAVNAYAVSNVANGWSLIDGTKLVGSLSGSQLLELSGSFVTALIALRSATRLQAYTIHSADVVGQIDNYAPGEVTILQLNPTAARSMTGMVAVSLGDFKFIKNVAAAGSGFNLTLEHAHASSSVGNKFSGAAGADVVVPPQGLALCIYNGTTSTWDAYLVN
jgi:hypothetical protein